MSAEGSIDNGKLTIGERLYCRGEPENLFSHATPETKALQNDSGGNWRTIRMKNLDFHIQNNETGGDFPFRVFCNRDILTPSHCHNEIEILCVLENSMLCTINGIAYTLKKDDIAVIPSGDIHNVVPSEHFRLVVQFRPELLESKHGGEDITNIYEALDSMERVSTRWKPSTAKKFRRALEELRNMEFAKTDTAYRLKIKSLLYDLVCVIMSEVPKSTEHEGKNKLMQNQKVLKNLERIFRYVQENYTQSISLGSAAAILHYSPNYFANVWKRYTGVPFHKYLNAYRIGRATFLLNDTELSVSEIAGQSGYDSIKSFNRVFKTVTGMSPSDYRKKRRTGIFNG